MWQAGRSAGSLKEVAAKVHCVTRAMMAAVPKAPGVKVLGISFISQREWGDFTKKFGAKSMVANPLLCWCIVVEHPPEPFCIYCYFA